jgi:hypothetical protein
MVVEPSTTEISQLTSLIVVTLFSPEKARETCPFMVNEGLTWPFLLSGAT